MKTMEKDSSVNSLVDEIVDEVMDAISKQKITTNEQAKNSNVKTIGDINDLAKTKNRLDILESKFEKYIANYKPAVEHEKYGTGKDNEKQVMELQGQIEVMRTNMIRLGNELRRIREILMKENLLK